MLLEQFEIILQNVKKKCRIFFLISVIRITVSARVQYNIVTLHVLTVLLKTRTVIVNDHNFFK